MWPKEFEDDTNIKDDSNITNTNNDIDDLLLVLIWSKHDDNDDEKAKPPSPFKSTCTEKVQKAPKDSTTTLNTGNHICK